MLYYVEQILMFCSWISVCLAVLYPIGLYPFAPQNQDTEQIGRDLYIRRSRFRMRPVV